ncbi:hypothetical protein ACS0TY_005091 [Phlomoides rotata]
MAESEVSMKLLIDTGRKRVLFAEAGKDCVDFLFFILSLPLSTLIRLLGKQQMVGSLGNLYESIETLNDSYIQPNINKDTLLKPLSPLSGYSVPLLSLESPQASTGKSFYRCHYHNNVTDDPRATCPSCSNKMSSIMTYVAPPDAVQQEASHVGTGGFVKEVVTYMVMDDLVVKPMSTISSITLLNQFNINNVSALEEKVVNLGINEVPL